MSELVENFTPSGLDAELPLTDDVMNTRELPSRAFLTEAALGMDHEDERDDEEEKQEEDEQTISAQEMQDHEGQEREEQSQPARDEVEEKQQQQEPSRDIDLLTSPVSHPSFSQPTEEREEESKTQTTPAPALPCPPHASTARPRARVRRARIPLATTTLSGTARLRLMEMKSRQLAEAEKKYDSLVAEQRLEAMHRKAMDERRRQEIQREREIRAATLRLAREHARIHAAKARMAVERRVEETSADIVTLAAARLDERQARLRADAAYALKEARASNALRMKQQEAAKKAIEEKWAEAEREALERVHREREEHRARKQQERAKRSTFSHSRTFHGMESATPLTERSHLRPHPPSSSPPAAPSSDNGTNAEDSYATATTPRSQSARSSVRPRPRPTRLAALPPPPPPVPPVPGRYAPFPIGHGRPRHANPINAFPSSHDPIHTSTTKPVPPTDGRSIAPMSRSARHSNIHPHDHARTNDENATTLSNATNAAAAVRTPSSRYILPRKHSTTDSATHDNSMRSPQTSRSQASPRRTPRTDAHRPSAHSGAHPSSSSTGNPVTATPNTVYISSVLTVEPSSATDNAATNTNTNTNTSSSDPIDSTPAHVMDSHLDLDASQALSLEQPS